MPTQIGRSNDRPIFCVFRFFGGCYTGGNSAKWYNGIKRYVPPTSMTPGARFFPLPARLHPAIPCATADTTTMPRRGSIMYPAVTTTLRLVGGSMLILLLLLVRGS